MPVTRRNTVVKWPGVRKPTARAISAIVTFPAASNADASSIRYRVVVDDEDHGRRRRHGVGARAK
jgi:hypothetical protein